MLMPAKNGAAPGCGHACSTQPRIAGGVRPFNF